MAYLNANTPPIYCQIRREYLYDLKKHHGEVQDAIIFGLSAISGRAILFHAIMENGAVFYRLPISAFIQKGFDPKKVPIRRLDELELWNSFSYYPAVTHWSLLGPSTGKYIGKIKNGITVNIYLLLTLHIQRVIFLTLIIQKFRTNTSAHT
jgi:hypothetical protein